mgnify:CR=1 FL=1
MTFVKKFTDQTGKIFIVEEVVETPVGLTVYYHNQSTGQKYSCLIDAFAEKFKELAQ